MIVSISGAGGFIGKALTRAFKEKGWTIKSINRESFSMPADEFRQTKIEGCDVVINLAGANISKRWNAAYKKEIHDSRMDATRKIVSAIMECSSKPGLLLSASGVDIYDNDGTHDEDSISFAGSFLGNVCRDWENEALSAVGSVRVVIPRMGMVLGEDGGAMSRMYPIFSMGLGAKIGKGGQWISFIHIKDLVNAFIFIIENESLSGPVNIVSPYPVTNAEFSSTFGKVLKQPVFLTLPGAILKFIYGEGAILLLEGHKVLPGKLTIMGFRFRYPTITNALVNLFG
ncbi:MAG: TIGR01777 family oxidoreductase [Bacteroidetes bacterium]|nr:TIGR01777 family oxidoreductase [Bacteroidota bacterium]